MSDFKELKIPQKCWRGWYIATEENPFAWLDINGDITSPLIDLMDLDILFFGDEIEAHEAAYSYYHKHGRVYPFEGETIIIGTMEIGSQIMEFE